MSSKSTVCRVLKLGRLEEIVFASLAFHGGLSSAKQVFAPIERHKDLDVAFGAVYTTLTRMVDKGYVDQFIETETGKDKPKQIRLYRATRAGIEAYRKSVAISAHFVAMTRLVGVLS